MLCLFSPVFWIISVQITSNPIGLKVMETFRTSYGFRLPTNHQKTLLSSPCPSGDIPGDRQVIGRAGVASCSQQGWMWYPFWESHFLSHIQWAPEECGMFLSPVSPTWLWLGDQGLGEIPGEKRCFICRRRQSACTSFQHLSSRLCPSLLLPLLLFLFLITLGTKSRGQQLDGRLSHVLLLLMLSRGGEGGCPVR